MTLKEFAEKYYLHDSFINSYHFNEETAQVILDISFAFWMQENYSESDPETGYLKVIFHEVTTFECKDGDPAGAFVGILKTEAHDDGFVITFLDDESGNCFDMIIHARSVTIE